MILFNLDTEYMNVAMVSSCDKQLVTYTSVYILEKSTT